MRHHQLTTLAAAFCLCMGAPAQTIERIRLTDNELSCAQIYAEVQQMDTAIQLAGNTPNTAAPQPVQPAAQALPSQAPLQAITAAQAAPQIAVPQGNFAFQGAVMADPQVRASIARARAAGMSDAQIAATLGVGMQRAGLAQIPPQTPAPMAAQLASANPAAAGFAGIFGAISGATSPPAAPAPQAASALSAPAAMTQAPAAAPNLARQAQARKEHLTTMFLSRGCKLADVQR